MASFTTDMDRSPPSLRIAIAHRPLLSYFILAFLGSWLLLLPIVLGQEGLRVFAYSISLPLYVVLFLLNSFSGPTLAAVIVTSALEGRAGLKQFFHRYVRFRAGLIWYLLAVFGFPLIHLLVASYWLGLTPWSSALTGWLDFFTSYIPALLIFPALITWGEEPGWRGFAQTRMQERIGALRAAIIVGFIHGIWHLPVFLLVSGPPALGPFSLNQFAINTLQIMIITILFTWVYNNTRQSIFFAVLIHASLNATPSLINQWLPDLPMPAEIAVIWVYAALALILILVTHSRLGYHQKTS